MQAVTRATVLSASLGAALIATAAAPAAAQDQQPATDTAVEVLEDVEVAEDHPIDDYDRDEYAPDGWIDATGEGCTTREDILARDLDPDTVEIDEDGCTVEYGETTGAYAGEWIEHVQGASEVDIEHVVAIGQAERNGAHAWDEERKQEFYQDPENLLAISSSENQSKSARDLTEYLPPNQGATCEFVASKVYIKDKWDLAMNQAEYDLAEEILTEEACTDTEAAPAQAMYTADWDTAAATDTEAVNADADDVDAIDDDTEATPMPQITENPTAVAIIAIVIIGLIVLTLAVPSLRRPASRAIRSGARRQTRRTARSMMRN